MTDGARRRRRRKTRSLRRISDVLVAAPRASPGCSCSRRRLLWLGIIYLGALFALLAQSFFSIDEFSGAVVYQPTLKTYAELLVARQSRYHHPHGRRVSTVVTLLAVIVAFPIAYYAARYARGRVKALFYVAVMMPLWSSYLVKVYAWKLLARQGRRGRLVHARGRPFCARSTPGSPTPIVGGPSLSVSYTGMVLVFLYLWTPFMVLAGAGGAGARAGRRSSRRPATSAPSPRRRSAT